MGLRIRDSRGVSNDPVDGEVDQERHHTREQHCRLGNERTTLLAQQHQALYNKYKNTQQLLILSTIFVIKTVIKHFLHFLLPDHSMWSWHVCVKCVFFVVCVCRVESDQSWQRPGSKYSFISSQRLEQRNNAEQEA